MNNFKTKIRTLLTALIPAIIFLITSQTLAQAGTPEEEKFCQKAYKMSCDEYKATEGDLNKSIQCQKSYGKSCAEYEAANAAELKAQQEGKAQAEKAAAEAECQKLYGTTCAQGKLNSDTNSLVEGTFSVTENLKLDNDEQPKKYFNDNSGESPIVSFILTIINFATTIMGSFAVILFIIAGFMFMVSGGNSQKLDEAKDVVRYAAIGLLVAFMAYVITIFVQSIFSNG